MALAGFGLTSCRRPEAHLVPFTKSVGMGDSGQAALLRDCDAAAQRRFAARRHDARWPADQGRWQSAPSREWWRLRSLRASFRSRSLRSGAFEIFRQQRQGATRSRDFRKISGRTAHERLRPMAGRVSRFSSRKRIRRRVNVCARSCKKFSRKCAGAFTIRCSVRRRVSARR